MSVSPQPPDHTADVELVQRVLRHDRRATDELLERVQVVRRIVSAKNASSGWPMDRAGLDDVVQDAYLTLWQRLDSYRGAGPIEAFAYRIVHFTWLTWMRRQKHRASGKEGGEDEGRSMEDALKELELEEAVLQVFERLSPSEAELMYFRYFDELSFDEIADRTGEPAGTLKTRYYRCIRRLRDAQRRSDDTGDEAA